MRPKNVLAIDFGTANTYFCKCSGDQRSPQGVDFRGGRDGLATAILYREGKDSIVGNAAIEEFLDATEQERKSYRFRAYFKPEIATGDEAQRIAVEFFKTILANAKAARIDLDPIPRQVVFGVPSEADEGFRKALSGIARDAGYGAIEMVDEPKGALLYHVHHKDIPATDAMRGVLVVDFGGGTCDFAFMSRGKIKHSWGDMRLGGRLFDDLFFQWLVETNPQAEVLMRNDGAKHFILSHLCREVKEFFSQTMTRSKHERVTKVVGRYGKISDMTWDEFEKRARAYTPSETFLEFLAAIRGPGADVKDFSPGTDLLEWFREQLGKSFKERAIDKSDVRFVILAGGSSQWRFVKEIVQEVLGVEESRIMRSDRPYAAIAEGLAILPALEREIHENKTKLKNELPSFLLQKIDPLVDDLTNGLSEEVAAKVTLELFDDQLRPLILSVCEEGGSIGKMKRAISSTTLAFGPRIESIVEEHCQKLPLLLHQGAGREMQEWFEEYCLVLPEWNTNSTQGDVTGLSDKYRFSGSELFSDMDVLIKILTTAIIAPLCSAICGGGGVALIAHGPLGLLIGGVVGIVLSVLVLIYGVGKARQVVEDVELYGWVRKLLRETVLRDKKIDAIRKKLKEEFKSTIQGALQQSKSSIRNTIKELVEKEIDALSEINRQ